MLEVVWTWIVLDVPWTVLEEPQLNPLPHELAASTGWFLSTGFEASNDAVAIATIVVSFMLPRRDEYLSASSCCFVSGALASAITPHESTLQVLRQNLPQCI